MWRASNKIDKGIAVFEDKKGKLHYSCEAATEANRAYDEEYNRETKRLESNNLTRYDILIAGVLCLATFTFLYVVQTVLNSGKGWLFLFGYLAGLVVSWMIWFYALKLSVGKRSLLYSAILIVGLVIGSYAQSNG